MGLPSVPFHDMNGAEGRGLFVTPLTQTAPTVWVATIPQAYTTGQNDWGGYLSIAHVRHARGRMDVNLWYMRTAEGGEL